MNKSLLLLVFISCVFHTACKDSSLTTGSYYYVDPVNGNDSNTGRSSEKPLQSLVKAGALSLQPGDRILLKGGQTFRGSLELIGQHGTETAPIVVSSFGEGRAIIESADSAAIIAENCSFLTCRNLVLKGSGRLSGSQTDGILFRNVRHGWIDSLEASGYLYSGIHVRGGSNIAITHAYAHDNGFSGIYAESGEPEYGTDGKKFKTLKNVYLGYSVAENNPGCPVITDNHSGNGILIAGVVNGMIEYCEAMENGWAMPREGNGPVGIWAFMSDSITIQHCYSHHNKTSERGKDGGGFDFDGGIKNSILQYNLSAFNEGAGYGIFQYAGATEWSGNIARYNISYNDGSKNSHAGFFMWCDPAAQPMKNFRAYNNTIVSSYGLGANFEPGAYADFFFENNIFLITGKTDRFVDGNYTLAVFIHNLYWSLYHADLQQQQPIFKDDRESVIADPEMILPEGNRFATIKPESLHTIPWFHLSSGSPGIKAGITVADHAGFDFWNNPIPADGKPNLGAWQGN
ncbi:MAG: right-handed parallel beta-helix repeat-containing protein [Bacteroidales bacterium]|nr:right-handed parallel beta-helix repeat-containing protein [Bacteroidales bacterium]